MLILLACADDPTAKDTGASPTTEDPGDTCATPVTYACEGNLTPTTAMTPMDDTVAVPHGPVHITAGDLDGDGVRTLYVGTNTTVTEVDLTTGATLDLWSQPDDGDAVYPVVGDVTGDGQDDLILDLPGSDDGQGQIVVFTGPFSQRQRWEDPHVEVKGGLIARFANLPRLADLDGDGLLDLAWLGEAHLHAVYAPITDRDFDLESPDATWRLRDDVAPADNGWKLGDVTGDGAVDLVVTEYVPVDPPSTDPCAPTTYAAARVLAGPFGVDDVPADFASAQVTLTEPGGYGMVEALTDWDGDGAPDIVALTGGTDADLMLPRVAVAPGPVTDGASATVGAVWPMVYCNWGADASGDGVADVICGGDPGTVLLLGLAIGGAPAAFTFDGPLDGLAPADLDACATSPRWIASPPGAALDDWGITWVGDLDDDGVVELAYAGDARWTDDAVVSVTPLR